MGENFRNKGGNFRGKLPAQRQAFNVHCMATCPQHQGDLERASLCASRRKIPARHLGRNNGPRRRRSR